MPRLQFTLRTLLVTSLPPAAASNQEGVAFGSSGSKKFAKKLVETVVDAVWILNIFWSETSLCGLLRHRIAYLQDDNLSTTRIFFPIPTTRHRAKRSRVHLDDVTRALGYHCLRRLRHLTAHWMLKKWAT